MVTMKAMAFVAGLCLATAAFAAPARAVHSPPLRLSVPGSFNRHLHLTPPPAHGRITSPGRPGAPGKVGAGARVPAKSLARKGRPAAHEFVHRFWHTRWNYVAWVVVHRHLGTIQGTVTNASGIGIPGVKMLLRKPRGGVFASLGMKHIVHSDGAGHFIMAGVRAGRYRVMAFSGKTSGQSQVLVHSGGAVGVRVSL